MTLAYENLGVVDGPVLRAVEKVKVRKARIAEVDEAFHEYLKKAQKEKGINKSSDVEKEFSIERSLRRGSTTRARVVGVPVSVVEANNGWKRVDRAGAKNASVRMHEHYTEIKDLIPLLIQYSEML